MDADSSLKAPNSVCWPCGGAAEPDAAYMAVLVAAKTRAPDALGFPVKTHRRWDEVRVPVPRCRTCRARNRGSIVTVFLAAALGCIVVPTAWSFFGPRQPPLWLFGGETPGHIMIGVGFVLGFVVAVLGVALRRRLSGLRSLKTYPPLVALRGQGWQWPSD